MLLNVIMASTNLFFIHFIIEKLERSSYVGITIGLASMIASMLYHLSEKRLGGCPVLRDYESAFLLIDRVFAVFSTIFIIYKPINWMTVAMAITSLYASDAAEIHRVLDLRPVQPASDRDYILIHAIWHMYAFQLLSDAL